MFWYLQIFGFVKDSTLHYIAKGSCPTGHCNAAKDFRIICDSSQNQKDICRNRCYRIWSRTVIILLYKTCQTTKEVCQTLNLCRHEKTDNMHCKNTASSETRWNRF